MRLYGYWRSGAAYRVRIALHLKGLAFETVAVALRRAAHREPAYGDVNPQHLVPTLEDGDLRLSQSLAIIEYLDEVYPAPALLPKSPAVRARTRQIALAIAADLHPLTNPRVLSYLEGVFGVDEDAQLAWRHHWMSLELGAVERLVDGVGPFALDAMPGLADICIVPQLYSARRYAFPLEAYPRLRRIEAACAGLAAFRQARPEVQPDAPVELANGG
jgi:maleylacetoacetate isomerase